MTKNERLSQIEAQIQNVKRLMWNASQMRRGSVCRLGDELDSLVEAKYRLIGEMGR